MSASGTKQTSQLDRQNSAIGTKRTFQTPARLSTFGPKRVGFWPGTVCFSDFTNGRGSGVDGPIRHAKPDRRTHTHEVPHRRAVPHRPDILQPPLAAALQ